MVKWSVINSGKSLIIAIATVAIGIATMPLAVAAQTVKLNVKDSVGTDKFVVTDSGSIGIGTSDPLSPIQVNVSGNNVASAGMMFRFTNTGTLSPIKAPNITLQRNNDPNLWPGGLPRKNDIIGIFQFGTLIGTAGYNMASLSVRAEEDVTSTLFPSYIAFSTTHDNDGVSQLTEKMRLSSIGNVGIGTTTPSQKLEVNGGARLNTTTTQPPCEANSRGTFWVTQNMTGLDTVDICIREATSPDSYHWYRVGLTRSP
ncbi:MAG: hypothetical protein M0023_02195 [Desulfobacteraceae bacterium]|nr:hypothetical protein [Desulfobacteraceae bacterium]